MMMHAQWAFDHKRFTKEPRRGVNERLVTFLEWLLAVESHWPEKNKSIFRLTVVSSLIMFVLA